jgi:hypothetical protein
MASDIHFQKAESSLDFVVNRICYVAGQKLASICTPDTPRLGTKLFSCQGPLVSWHLGSCAIQAACIIVSGVLDVWQPVYNQF